MNDKIVRRALVAAILWIGFGAAGRAEAGPIALTTPAGISVGESFRFVFITDGTNDASSTNIADYNNFVNAQAGGGHVQRFGGHVGRDRLDVIGERHQ